MDTKYQYETFNGLPVYYGGDKYDSDDSEEFFLDTPEEMNNRIRNQSRPDGGDNKSVNMVDVTPKGNTASKRLGSEVFNNAVEEDSDTSRTMTSELDDTDFQMGSLIWDDTYSPVWIAAPCMVNSEGQAEELWLNKGEVACMSDFDDEDFTDMDVDSDAVSDMKFDYDTGKSGNPQSDPNTDMCTHAGKKEIVNHAGDKYNPEEDVCCANIPAVNWASGYIDCARYLVPQCLLKWPCRRDGDVHVMNNVNDGKLEHSLTPAWFVNAEDSSYIAVCFDCPWLIDQLRNLIFEFYRWIMLIHTRLEGPRDGQIITEIRTAGGWQYSDVYSMPLRMLSAGGILRPLIGCRPQMVGSAEQSSHIRRDPRVCQAVVAAPVTGSLVHIRNTVGTVFSPQKRTYGGTDQIKGTVFQVWLQIIAVGCNMDAATSVLPWDATEAVVDVSVAGVEIQHSLPDAMGLEGRTRHATQSRILRGRDPRSIRVLIPDGQGTDQSVHDVTIVDMEKLPEPHVPILQLAELIHRWPPVVINHMIERMRSVAKTELKHNSRKPCTFCGACIKIDMYRHLARCHLQLAQLWRCPVPWCTIWKGTSQDLMSHIVLGHKVSGETKRACLQKLFPPWRQYVESLSPKRSGISNDVLLFSEVGLTLVHHYRVHSAGQPHAMFRGKYLAQLRLLLLTGTTTPTPERPLGNASPKVTHVSGKTDDSCARLRPLLERPLGNASPQVTQMSGITDDLCARPRPPGRRRRSQRWIQISATHVAPRLTEQDPRMAAGAVVFDCRPAVLLVSVDVSGIDM